MKLATFSFDTPLGRATRVGMPVGGTMIDLTAAAEYALSRRYTTGRARELAHALVPPEMVAFIETGEPALELAASVAELAAQDRLPAEVDGSRVSWAAAEVSWEAPLRPRSLREFGVFPAHLAHLGITVPPAWYRLPMYFKSSTASVVGTDTTVRWPVFTAQLDFELELAAVIGRRVQDVAEADALAAVFGYTIFNDFSARDIQRAEQTYQVGPAKGKDFCNALGPVIVTRDEFDPVDAHVTARVNGTVWADTDTSGMHFTWDALVAHAAYEEPLVPGDVLTAGTVPGCCATEYFLDCGRSTDDGLLQPGDVVELEVEGIGTLRNTVGPRPAELRLDY